MWQEAIYVVLSILTVILCTLHAYNIGRQATLKDANEQVIKAEEQRLGTLVERDFYRVAYETENKRFRRLERAYNRIVRHRGGSSDPADWWRDGGKDGN